MKKVILLVLTLVFCFSSCSKDDDNTDSEDNRIIGTWGSYKYVDLDNDYTEYYDVDDISTQMTFKENGILEYYDADENGNLEHTYIESWMHVEKTRYSTTWGGNEVQYYYEFVSDNEMRERQYDIIDDGFEEFNEWIYYKRIK